jgi:nucleotide-binding universal stress UspA family protein
MLSRIAHTTDFSPDSVVAFLLALRLALDTRGRLDILHVKDRAEEEAWRSFPHVREALVRWGLLDAGATPADIEAKLGVHVAKIEIDDRDATVGIGTFLLSHRPDLLVLATHGREGFNRWLHGSISEQLVERIHVPTLLVGPEARGFVDARTGHMRLRRILFPVAPSPAPAKAISRLLSLLSPLGVTRDCVEPMNVGASVSDVIDDSGETIEVEQLQGPIAETILRVAKDRRSDLIVMPTAGHHGFLDAVRGSTTSRVLAHAPCPVLALPLIGP